MKVSIKVGQIVSIGGVEMKAVAFNTQSEGNGPTKGVMTFEMADEQAANVVGATVVPPE